jgi:hypothetical protein
MGIPFDRFEQYIDEKILGRGLDYFHGGEVGEPEEISAGEYESIVTGSQNYTVRLKVKNNELVEYFCDCPYDGGPVCKHIVAVIFQLQQDALNFEPPVKKTKKKKPAKKRKTIADKINEILTAASPDEIIGFIRERAHFDRDFRNAFLLEFTKYHTDDTKSEYKKKVKAIIKSAAGRHGFIDYYSANRLFQEIQHLLYSAGKEMESDNFESAFRICTAVLEELTNALDYADDSDGSIGGCIEDAMTLLGEMVSEEHTEKFGRQFLDYTFDACEKGLFKEWDWHLDLLRISSELVDSDDDINKLFALLDEAGGRPYRQEQSQFIKYTVLERTQGESAAEKYLEENLANSRLRGIAIEKAFNANNFKKAGKLALDGIKQDAKDKPGLVKNWKEWLIKIARAKNDTENIIKYARELFFDNTGIEDGHYELMKSNVSPEDWPDYFEGIVSELKKSKRWQHEHMLAQILIKEKMWNRLMAIVRKSPSLDMLDNYAKYLAMDYQAEIIKLYAEAVKDYLENNVSRKHYKTACGYLKKIKNYGGGETVDILVSEFREKYKMRKALLEELRYF